MGNVFGRILIGDQVKHNYVFGTPTAMNAYRIPFPDAINSGNLTANATATAASDGVRLKI